MSKSEPQTDKSVSDRTLLEHYERVIEISRQLNSTFDHVSLLKQIVAAATELTNTSDASILLIDPSTGELRFEISSNINPHEMEEIIVPMEGSIAGWVVTHGEPRVIFDAAHEPEHFGGVGETIEYVTRNMVAVPMRTHKEVIGVLEALNKLDNETFNEIDVNILTTLANHAAIAIENARLFRQSDFIAEMVHELRTPLMSLKASTNLLLRPNIPEEMRHDTVLTMQNETSRLIQLATDFLDLARMESGRTQLRIEPFELSNLLSECARDVTSLADEKQIKIEVRSEIYSVAGDRGKLKQVLLNLLTNAIKYNRPEGEIHIYSDPAQLQEQPMVQVAVEDTGYGLSKENQKQIFQKFFRAKKTADQTTGTGLGLVITKHIVEAHGGHISMQSEEGVGTTFFFTVPMEE
jgi:signal transduction histidine kinase